mgnify:CR=1 FL=1
MKLRILLIAGSLLFTLIAMPAYASGGNCPAFTSSMIDAAFLATEYSQADPVKGEANDFPNEPSIFCEFTNGDAK